MFKGRAPEGTDYPYIVFFPVTDVQVDTFKDKLDDVLIQFSLFSSSSSTTEIEGMYEDLKTLYDDCSLTITNATLCLMHRMNMQPMTEEHTTPDGMAEIWHYAVDYSIVQQRT
jgi:hypothetical protein